MACTLTAVLVGTAAAPIGAAPAVPVPAVPTPSEVVRETGAWISHGYALELWSDGTGTFSVWRGAFDGTRVRLRLIPAPGAATVAEVTAVEVMGAGALGAEAAPAPGGLMTIMVGDPVRTAHVEWSSGPSRLVADLCPAQGLDAVQMAALRCGA